MLVFSALSEVTALCLLVLVFGYLILLFSLLHLVFRFFSYVVFLFRRQCSFCFDVVRCCRILFHLGVLVVGR